MSEKLTTIWSDIKGLISARVSEDTLGRWFSNIRIIDLDEMTLTLEAPNQIYQFWIETNYLSILTDAVETVIGKREIGFRFIEKLNEEALGEVADISKVKKPKADIRRSRATRTHEELASDADLNLRYTFDSFVVGANTEFAHAAAKAAAAKPGMTYNPLFIYGDAGLGKTHLMHAVGHAILQERPKAKVVYITSERFTNEFIAAIGSGSLVKFRQRYREADVLLIDDIQFLAGKEKSQEEFFHTFNALCDTRNKQIVLSSDFAASKIRNLEHRLVSRFEWGLTAEISAPDTETRIAILKKKMEEWQVSVAPNIIEYLAERIRNNVRRLEGALIRLASYSSLNAGALDIRAAERLLEDILQDEGAKDISISQIQKLVADFYDVRLTDLLGRKRPANIALARQVAMYFARELTNASYQEIGDAFGGRDHGTAMHACRSVEQKLKKQEKVRHQVDNLLGQISSKRDH